MCKYCNKKIEGNFINIKNILCHKECYKNKMLEVYSSGCGYCKKQIINKEMDIYEIEEILKNTTPFNKIGLTYHCKCFQYKIENDKNIDLNLIDMVN